MVVSLLPCPFCGKEDGLYPAHHRMGGGKPYAIDCVSCGFDFTPREGMDVVALWNKRSNPQQGVSTVSVDISKIKVGDIVTVQMRVAEVDPEDDITPLRLTHDDLEEVWVPGSAIVSHTPRELEVGETVEGPFVATAVILGIDGDTAWVRMTNDRRREVKVSDLERIP